MHHTETDARALRAAAQVCLSCYAPSSLPVAKPMHLPLRKSGLLVPRVVTGAGVSHHRSIPSVQQSDAAASTAAHRASHRIDVRDAMARPRIRPRSASCGKGISLQRLVGSAELDCLRVGAHAGLSRIPWRTTACLAQHARPHRVSDVPLLLTDHSDRWSRRYCCAASTPRATRPPTCWRCFRR
jgi:hypothetical protein